MDETAWRSTSLEWTEDVSPAGNFPYFIWNGQIVRPELAASHTLKKEAFHAPPPLLWKIALLFKMDRWMSLQQGFSHTLWNGLMELPGLAGSHTSEDFASLLLKWYRRRWLRPKPLKLDVRTGWFSLQHREGPSNIEKLTALLMYNAHSLLSM